MTQHRTVDNDAHDPGLQLDMRIVHVVHALGTGGMEKGVATIIQNASPDIEHAVVCLERTGASEQLLPTGTPVVALGKRSGHSFYFLVRLARTLKKLRPHVVHSRNWGGLDAVVASRIAGIRQVIHGEHGWTTADLHGRMPRRVRVRRLLERWTREYTCVSREIKHWLRSVVGIRSPITRICNGVDTSRFRPTTERGRIRAALGIPLDAFVVTVCGRLDPIKDHSTLLRAVNSIRATGVPARLLIVGGGPERSRLEREADDATIILGTRQDVPEILRDSDVFALTSLNEGLSNTILEAMATGLPVVATGVGGNPELVEHESTGVLVEPGDHIAVAQSLRDYFRYPRRRAEHGAAGRQRAIDHFGVLSMVAAYEEVYRRCGGSTFGTRPLGTTRTPPSASPS